MKDTFHISVDNKLKEEKRDLNVYQHSHKGAHIISYNSSITLPLGTQEEEDYLHISVVSGPGNMWKECMVDVPSWVDFIFSAAGKVTVMHSGGRTKLIIPPGPPTWQLKITRPEGNHRRQASEKIIIGNNGYFSMPEI